MTLHQPAADGEEEPREPRVPRPRDPCTSQQQGPCGGHGRPAARRPSLLHLGSRSSTWLWLAVSTHGWCLSVAWLASIQPGHLDFASMFCYEPGKQASSSPCKLPPSMSCPMLVPRETGFLFLFLFFPTLTPSLAPWLNYRDLEEDHAVGRGRGEEALSGNGGAKSVQGWSLHLQSCPSARKGESHRPISWVLGLLGCGSYKAFSGASLSSRVDLLWTELCPSALLPPNSDAGVLTPRTTDRTVFGDRVLRKVK